MWVQGSTVFRVTVIAIVLMLAASPLSQLACGTECTSIGAQAVTGDASHHEIVFGAGPLTGDRCARAVLDTRAFVREDTKRLGSCAEGRAVFVTSRQFPPRLTAARYVVNRSVERSFNVSHLLLVLRI